MNAKMAKKLRWYARAQEMAMPDIMVNSKGIPSTLLVYEHKKVFKDAEGNERDFTNITIQYNPRTSGKGFYRVLKKKRARIKGSIEQCRTICAIRCTELLAARAQRDRDRANNPGPQPADESAGAPAVVAGGAEDADANSVVGNALTDAPDRGANGV